MKTMSVKEIRKNLAGVIRDAESGDTTVITRFGNPIAAVAPIRKERGKLPDLTEFRKSIRVRGKALSRVVCEARNESRF